MKCSQGKAREYYKDLSAFARANRLKIGQMSWCFKVGNSFVSKPTKTHQSEALKII